MNPPPPEILIVDDEAAVRRLLAQTLERVGYHCREAGDARQALAELRRQAAELVILDIKMPGQPGTELLPRIRERYPDTPVIMATATSDVATAVRCLRLGAYDYITKPFNLEEMTLSVARALEKQRLELENRDYQQNLERKVREQAARIRSTFLNAITALAYALEAKDEYTSGHSQRVSQIAGDIARELGLPPEEITRIELAGRVHDIGKIGVRETILNKTGRLSTREFDHIRHHPEIGERILTPLVDDREILRIVRHHHERYDGSGYPDGLVGEQIPLGARILAIADSYDAMTSARPYRDAMNPEAAGCALENCQDSQFDPAVVRAFIRTLAVSSPSPSPR